MFKTIKPFFLLLTQSDWLLYSEWVPSYLNTPSQKIKKKSTNPTPTQKKKPPKKFKIKQTHPFYFIDKLSNLLKITQWIFKKYVKQTMSFPNLNMQLPRYRHFSKGLLQMYIYFTVNGRVQKCYRQVDLLIRVFG